MTTFVIVENPSPSFISIAASSDATLINYDETYSITTMESAEVSFITSVEQGPAGPPGTLDDLELPDLSLIFEGALI